MNKQKSTIRIRTTYDGITHERTFKVTPNQCQKIASILFENIKQQSQTEKMDKTYFEWLLLNSGKNSIEHTAEIIKGAN